MHRSTRFIVAIAAFGMAAVAFGQETKPEEPQKIVSTATTLQRAKVIDFSAELGLPVKTLINLGEQIDGAREAMDPVGLAAAAQLLRAAETASGKKARLTADALTEEAVKLAKLRNNPAELATAAALVTGKTSEELKQLATRAAEEESDTTAETRDVDGTLHVDNHTHDYLHIYANGYEVGHVPPHSVRQFHVHHAVHLEARGQFTYAHEDVHHYHTHFYQWLIGHHPH